MNHFDVIIIGAGAAGLMCAHEAGYRGRKVLVLDHANKPGKKILMSGGGRCNFTNYHVTPDAYISHNSHFSKSALSRYTQWDFIELVKKHRIPYHEKTLGQLFCDNKSHDILNMLLAECEQANVTIQLNTSVTRIDRTDNGQFFIQTPEEKLYCQSLVIACGGLSIPTMGASPFGYKVAEQFGLKIMPTRAGLVPLTLHPEDKDRLAPLSGIAVDCQVQSKRKQFRENILFTHRGLSGPAILQISSYWLPGEEIYINLLPEIELFEELKKLQKLQPQKQINTLMADYLPKRVVEIFIPAEMAKEKLGALSHQTLEKIANLINDFSIKPNGTEGYRTAEVTLGGVDCDAISSKTMEVKTISGLFFIGEVLDVTGWLGGYNFQWAWSSAWAAGQVV